MFVIKSLAFKSNKNHNNHGYKYRDHGKSCKQTNSNQYSAKELGKDHQVIRSFDTKTDIVFEHRQVLVVMFDLPIANINEEATKY